MVCFRSRVKAGNYLGYSSEFREGFGIWRLDRISLEGIEGLMYEGRCPKPKTENPKP